MSRSFHPLSLRAAAILMGGGLVGMVDADVGWNGNGGESGLIPGLLMLIDAEAEEADRDGRTEVDGVDERLGLPCWLLSALFDPDPSPAPAPDPDPDPIVKTMSN